jgi:hypothetical protein
MNKVMIVALMIVSRLFAFTDSGDTGSTQQIIVQIQHRMDSLETEFQKLKIEKSDNNPGATGEIKDWGKGYYLGAHIGFNTTDAEIGFMFKQKHCRIGPAVGFSFYDWYKPATAFGKFNVGTPIFLNFISVLGFASTFVIFPNAVQGHPDPIFGVGFGTEFEFWIIKYWNITLGQTIVEYPFGHKFTSSEISFGVKHFF